MINILIIDDESLARQRIAKLLQQRKDVNILKECRTGHEAIEAIEYYQPDLIFLDIKMKDMSGFDVLRSLPQQSWPLTIFVTAYNEYAIQAFNVFAFDYLLKPFKEERFFLSVKKAIHAIEQKDQQAHIEQLKGVVEFLQKKQKSAPIPLKQGSKISLVHPEDIQYIEASGYYIEVYTNEQKRLLLRESMTNMLEQLDHPKFMRIHRSSIINMDYLSEVIHTGSGDVACKMKNGKTFRVSKSYKEVLFDRINA